MADPGTVQCASLPLQRLSWHAGRPRVPWSSLDGRSAPTLRRLESQTSPAGVRRLNVDGVEERLDALLDEWDGSQRCANAILEPSGTDPGSVECLSGDDRRPRAACHVPICQMGRCTILVAFDEQRDTQNYMRVLGSDPKMLLFGLRHMSVASDQGDGRLTVEFTDVPNDTPDRESLIIDIGFQVEIKYKAKTAREHTSLVFKVFPGLDPGYLDFSTSGSVSTTMRYVSARTRTSATRC